MAVPSKLALWTAAHALHPSYGSATGNARGAVDRFRKLIPCMGSSPDNRPRTSECSQIQGSRYFYQLTFSFLEYSLSHTTSPPDDIHTILGQTDLPTALAKLLSAASESSGRDIPTDSAAPATFEVLRVAANVVLDHGMFVCISV